MKGKVIWLIVTCLMVLSLVLASCAPAAPPAEEKPSPPTEEKPAPSEEEKLVLEKPAAPEEKAEMVKMQLKKTDGTLVEKWMEKPRYGGVLVQSLTSRPLIFDDALGVILMAPSLYLTNENLISGDWTRGPTGTGEVTWWTLYYPPTYSQMGRVAESWELTDPQTLTYHIRKGIHFHDKPPTNGRELTADDVAFSLKRNWTTTTAYLCGNYPWKTHFQELDGGPWIKATDKWTVVLKTLPAKTPYVYEMATDFCRIFPRDAVEKYGNMNDWRNACGTGPFLLTDYVTDSTLTFVRNPNYYMKDPFFPNNQLPYLDGIKYLIIPDLSTRIAALRTGKMDWISGGILREDMESLLKSNPVLKYLGRPPSTGGELAWRVDKPELPWYDKRVRQALWMAIDNQGIIDEIYHGEASMYSYPACPYPELADVHIPVKELPESVRELFEYHPDKARQLLAEAGYPQGFKMEVITDKRYADIVAVIKAYFKEVGVDLEIVVKEYGALTSIEAAKTYPDAVYDAHVGGAIPFKLLNLRPGDRYNYCMADDPVINEQREKIMAAYFNEAEKRRLTREIVPYVLEQAYLLQMPGGYEYVLWQPWLKGYSGERQVGYQHQPNFQQFVWLDLDLKEKLTGRR